MKACRPKPFGEWVIVYYDAKKTNLETMRKRLRENGCKDAEQVTAKPVEADAAKIGLANPISVPGDFIDLPLEGFKKAPDVEVPEGWTVVVKSKDRLKIQTPAKAKPGEHALKVAGVELKLELVPIVK